MKERVGAAALTIAALLVLYMAAAFVCFGLRHPRYTDTQRLLLWRDAARWR